MSKLGNVHTQRNDRSIVNLALENRISKLHWEVLTKTSKDTQGYINLFMEGST